MPNRRACTFINFEKKIPLHGLIWACTFILPYTSIRHTRVVHIDFVHRWHLLSQFSMKVLLSQFSMKVLLSPFSMKGLSVTWPRYRLVYKSRRTNYKLYTTLHQTVKTTGRAFWSVWMKSFSVKTTGRAFWSVWIIWFK